MLEVCRLQARSSCRSGGPRAPRGGEARSRAAAARPGVRQGQGSQAQRVRRAGSTASRSAHNVPGVRMRQLSRRPRFHVVAHGGERSVRLQGHGLAVGDAHDPLLAERGVQLREGEQLASPPTCAIAKARSPGSTSRLVSGLRPSVVVTDVLPGCTPGAHSFTHPPRRGRARPAPPDAPSRRSRCGGPTGRPSSPGRIGCARSGA